MFRINMKKALALLASALILCSLIPLSTLFVANAAGENMLTNGDFENGKDGWSFNSGTAEIVSDAHGGSSALKLSNPNAWGEAAIRTIAVEKNTDYQAVWYSKRVAGTGSFNLTICQTASPWGNAEKVSGQNWMNETSGNWVKNTYVFNSGNNNEFFFKFTAEINNAGSVLIDDVVLTKVGGDGPSDPVTGLVNGDFETGDETGWTVYQGTATKAAAKKNGSYGMHLTGAGGWGGMAFQNVTVVPGKEYTISMWLKTVSNGVNIQIKDGGTGGTNLEGKWFNSTAWSQVLFTVTPTTDTLCINICGSGSGSAESVYLDDVTMVVKGSVIPTPGNGMINGDFETGDLTGWSPWQQTEISADAKKNGSYGAVLKGDGSWGGLLDQNLTVESGKTYTLSFWYKANSGGANFVVKDNGTGLASYWANATSWTQFTLEFTASSTSLLLNICGGGDGVASNLYVDDFVLTEKAGGEPDIPDIPDVPEPPTTSAFQNGDFETGDLTGWAPSQGTEISADAKKNGSYGAKLVGDGGWGGLLDQTFSVEAGKTYTMTFWYKAIAGGANFVVKENGTGIASTWANATSWTQITLEFTPSTTSLLLNICGGGDGVPAEVYVDDFVVAAKPSAQMGLINGDFEDGTNGWILNDQTKLETTDVHAGSGALYVAAPGAYGEAAYQVMGLEPNTDYVLTWYGKRVSGNGAYCVFLMNEDGFANMTVEGATWMNETSGKWVKYEVTFNSGTVTEMRMKWGPESADAGAVLIDDIILKKAGEEPESPNKIKNGSFEDGEDNWKLGGKTELIDNDPYEGTNSIRLDADKAWTEALTQTVKVEKNTDYVVWFFSKRVSGNGTWNLTLMDADTINNGDKNVPLKEGSQNWINHNTKNKWEETRIEFNSGDITKVFFKFTPEADNAGVFLVDYVCMYVKGTEPSPDDPDAPVVPPAAQMYMTSYGVLNNRPISASDNLLKNGDFESKGGQWQTGFTGDTISIKKSSSHLFDGEKSLFFNTAGIDEETKLIFWMDVKPETSYVFSTWLKGEYLADDNRGLATIGIVNENGSFLSMYQENDITRFLNGERQIVPTAWDNEWHLRGIEFNTGDATKLGICLAGKNSQMWVDDMALFEVGTGTKYMSANAGGSVNLSYDIENWACADKDSLIPDPTFSKGLNDFWKSSYGWSNGFLSVAENKYEYGASLKYTGTEDRAPLSIIKTISVKPNTEYTFAVDVKILEDGWGKLVLFDGKKREPVNFLQVSFDSYDYDPETSYYGWYTTVCKFNTGVYDEISLAVVDDGGVALLDNMRLYESTKGKEVTDTFVPPPEEPEQVPDEEEYYPEYPYEPEIPVEPETPELEEPVIEDVPVEDPDINDEPDQPTDVLPNKDKTADNSWIWIVIGCGAAVLAGGGAFLFFFLKKRKGGDANPPAAE